MSDVDTSVRAGTVTPDGRVLFGGAFSSVSGLARHGFAALRSDGFVDPTFQPDFGNELGAKITRMMSLPDGRVLVAGTFSRMDGVESSGLVRLLAKPIPSDQGARRAIVFDEQFLQYQGGCSGTQMVAVIRTGDLGVTDRFRVTSTALSARPGIDFLPVDDRFEFQPGESRVLVPVAIPITVDRGSLRTFELHLSEAGVRTELTTNQMTLAANSVFGGNLGCSQRNVVIEGKRTEISIVYPGHASDPPASYVGLRARPGTASEGKSLTLTFARPGTANVFTATIQTRHAAEEPGDRYFFVEFYEGDTGKTVESVPPTRVWIVAPPVGLDGTASSFAEGPEPNPSVFASGAFVLSDTGAASLLKLGEGGKPLADFRAPRFPEGAVSGCSPLRDGSVLVWGSLSGGVRRPRGGVVRLWPNGDRDYPYELGGAEDPNLSCAGSELTTFVLSVEDDNSLWVWRHWNATPACPSPVPVIQHLSGAGSLMWSMPLPSKAAPVALFPRPDNGFVFQGEGVLGSVDRNGTIREWRTNRSVAAARLPDGRLWTARSPTASPVLSPALELLSAAGESLRHHDSISIGGVTYAGLDVRTLVVRPDGKTWAAGSVNLNPPATVLFLLKQSGDIEPGSEVLFPSPRRRITALQTVSGGEILARFQMDSAGPIPPWILLDPEGRDYGDARIKLTKVTDDGAVTFIFRGQALQDSYLEVSDDMQTWRRIFQNQGPISTLAFTDFPSALRSAASYYRLGK